MSLKTWKAEFYPRTANKAKRSSWLACVRHSLRKWSGALKANREHHGLLYRSRMLYEEFNNQFLRFDATTCALCAKVAALHDGALDCKACPLAQQALREDNEMDTIYPGGSGCQPYWDAVCNDPRPMVAALKRLVRSMEKKNEAVPLEPPV